MSYKSYRARVQRQRAALQAELTQANDLRCVSHLPLWDMVASGCVVGILELGRRAELRT